MAMRGLATERHPEISRSVPTAAIRPQMNSVNSSGTMIRQVITSGSTGGGDMSAALRRNFMSAADFIPVVKRLMLRPSFFWMRSAGFSRGEFRRHCHPTWRRIGDFSRRPHREEPYV